MTDPFPELPRRVLFVDKDGNFRGMEVTKPWSPVPAAMKPVPVTKPATKLVQRNATKVTDATKLGRPAKGDKPMTSTERSRLRRAAKK